MRKKNAEIKEETAKGCEEEEILEGESVAEAEIKEDEEFEGIENTEETSTEDCCKELKDENLKFKNEVTKLNNELETLKDRLLRTNAEYDNFRKRTAKEKEGIYTDACMDVLKAVLPVFDNLERAANSEGSFEDLKKGIDMTIRQFTGALEKLSVEVISTDGEFDPNLHNAVMHVEDEAFGKNSVVEVFQKGYKRGDKVIRHSMVKVAN